MNKKQMGITAAVGATLVIGGLVWSYERMGGRKADLAPPVERAIEATVPIEQAIKTALENFPGRVIKAGLEHRGPGTMWTVDIATAEQGIMSVRINGESGSVLETEGPGAAATAESLSKPRRTAAPTL
jgi:uncharacterized membrane protein YkoI